MYVCGTGMRSTTKRDAGLPPDLHAAAAHPGHVSEAGAAGHLGDVGDIQELVHRLFQPQQLVQRQRGADRAGGAGPEAAADRYAQAGSRRAPAGPSAAGRRRPWSTPRRACPFRKIPGRSASEASVRAPSSIDSPAPQEPVRSGSGRREPRKSR